MNKNRDIINDGAVIIEGNKILDVDRSKIIRSKYGEEGKIIDGTGMLVIPGLINAHTHTYEILFRGLGDDLGPLLNWSNTLLRPFSPFLDSEVVYISALLSCLEMVKSGTSFFVDHPCQNTAEAAIDQTARAIKEVGLRGLIAKGMWPQTGRLTKMGFEGNPSLDEEVKLTEKLICKWHGKADGRILVCPAPVISAWVEDELIMEAKRISDKYDVPIHAHTAEVPDEVQASLEDYGKREVERLYDLGVLGPKFHVVHGVWLNASEIEKMGKTKANLIHCPVSNMYLASGVAPVPQLLKAGANVALGADVSCNENNDMIRVMKAAALLHKVHNLDPKAISAGQAFEMGTLGGARSLGLESEIGSIEAGKKADLVLINMMKPHLVPAHRMIATLVYCADGADVETVIIDGKITMENREVKTVDEQMIINKALEVGRNLIERGDINHLRNRSQFTKPD